MFKPDKYAKEDANLIVVSCQKFSDNSCMFRKKVLKSKHIQKICMKWL